MQPLSFLQSPVLEYLEMHTGRELLLSLIIDSFIKNKTQIIYSKIIYYISMSYNNNNNNNNNIYNSNDN